MKRKLLSIILAIFMVFGIIPFTSQASDSRGYTDAYETLTKEMDNKLEDGKEYEFIVEIFENNRPVSRQRRDLTAQTYSSAARRGRELSLVEKRINDQNEVLADIFGERQIRRHSDEISYSTMSRASSFRARNNSRPIIRNTEQLKTMPRYKALLNGFALRMTYAEAKQVAMLPNVKAVTKAVEYKMPEKPFMDASKKIIHADYSTEKGYDGRGRVVAILDTGADVNHPDFRLSDVGLAAAKYKDEDSTYAVIDKFHLWGKYETPKIPYAYNYADRSFDILDKADHGQHIAGTIAGNAKEPSKGVVGVVPEAQLLVMRVFPIGKPGTNTAIYAEAIDDAVLLGADSINMSLGSFAGSEDADKIMTKVVQNANEHGSIVCIAGGNDGYQFSKNHYQPSNILDFATVGAPATMKESLAVASFNNSKITMHSAEIEVNGTKYPVSQAEFAKSRPQKLLELGKNYDLVFVGKGNSPDDYTEDVTGKIVLAERGGANFAQKSALAASKGAVGCIIGYILINPGEREDFTYQPYIETDDSVVPTYGLSNKLYLELKQKLVENKGVIKFNQFDSLSQESPSKNIMSDFSSWGPTPGLGIKPEITAPGGDIWSTANNNGYQSMSGTSMATPHVAAGIAAVRGKLATMNNLGLKDNQIAMFVKKVLMNTAKPARTLDDSGYFSVRNQGAGIMDLKDATSGKYVTVEDNDSTRTSFGDAKIEFKQIQETILNVNVKLQSYLDEKVKYNVSYVLQTDDVDKNGSVNLEPDEYKPIKLGEGKLGSIELGSKESTVFAQSINWQENQSLSEKYQKGYFVDGYLFFTPEGSEVPSLTIPMLAFKGGWSDLTIFENFIHEYNLETERPLWLPAKEINEYIDFTKPEGIYNAHIDDINATMLLTNMVDVGNERSFRNALGRGIDGKFTDNLAISPGVKDKSQDSFKFRGVFLRNWDDFYMEILDDQGVLVKKIENPYRKSGRKSGYTVNGTEVYSISEDPWFWDGTNTAGDQVPEGIYTLKVHAKTPNNPNAKDQIIEVKVKVDNTKPTIEGKPDFDDLNRRLIFKASDEGSGIKAVIYSYETGDPKNPIAWSATNKLIGDSYVVDGFNKDTGMVYVVDWAGNITKLDLGAKGNNSIVIKRDSKEYPGVEIAVYDKDRNKMTNLEALEDGEYTIEAINIPEGVNVEIKPDKVKFPKEDKSKTETVNVKFTKVAQDDIDKYGTLKVRVLFSDELYSGFTVFATDKNGKKFQLYKNFDWGSETYGAKVPAGDYTISVIDPNGDMLEFDGEKEATVSKQDEIIKEIRFARNGELQVFMWSNDPELISKIKSLSKETDKKNVYKINVKEIFRIYNPVSKRDLFEGKDEYIAKIYPWSNGEGFDIKIPADGDYTVEFINDDKSYVVVPGRVNAELFIGDEAKWVGMDILKPKEETATITIDDYIIGEDPHEQINAIYHLYDSYGNEVPSTSTKSWEDIPAEVYTLEVENLNDKLIPEKKVYKINAYDNLYVKQTIRWKDLTKEDFERYTSLVIGAYGDFDRENRDVNVELKNTVTEEIIDAKIVAGTKVYEDTIPLGSYEVTVTLPNGTIINNIFLSVNEFNDSKDELTALGRKFNVTFTSSFNEIEINLKRQKRDFGEVEVDVVGLYEGKATYELVKDGKAVYTSNDGIFRDVAPGEYKLKVTAPNGYTADKQEQEVEVKIGEISTPSVKYTKDLNSAKKVVVNVKAVEVNSHDNFLRNLKGIEYVAVDKDNEEYKLDQIPAGIQVKLLEIDDTIPVGYIRYTEFDGYRVFEENSDITIKYMNDYVFTTDPESDETINGYVKVLFDAKGHGVLNAPGIENVQKIAYFVKDNYAMNDFDFYVPKVKANENYKFNSWKPTVEVKNGTYVAQYDYNAPVVPTPTPDPDPTPDEPIIPDYPVIPDRPRPYRPTTPTKDIVKDTTKPTETVKPVEEKKDYGIVETMPTIAATFSDLPENAAAGSIMNMVARGILKGMDNGKFEGELPITRAMVATVLKRLSKDQTINNVKSFTDVKDKDWFADAVKWAQSQGLIKGYEDGTFKANNLVTRQELAIIVERFLKAHGITMDEIKELSYKDLDTLPAWSKDAIIAMAKIGLVEGQTEEMYNPASQFTREELAVMIEKIIIWVEKH